MREGLRYGQTYRVNGEEVVITGKCTVTHKDHSITVPREDFDTWRGGEYVHVAMPHVGRAAREFLISGISPAGWEKLFGKDEDDATGPISEQADGSTGVADAPALEDVETFDPALDPKHREDGSPKDPENFLSEPPDDVPISRR